MRRGILCAALAAVAAGTAFAAKAQPIHYRLAVRLDPARHRLAADAQVRFAVSRGGGERRFMLGSGYRVISLRPTAGAQVTSSVDGGGPRIIALRVPPGGGSGVGFDLAYEGPLADTGDPPVNAIDPARIELSADALWYPLSTDFNARSTVEADITGVPRGLVVASPDQVRKRAGGFHLSRRIPSQDIAFSAAPDFHTVAVGRLRFFARDLDSDQARNYRRYGPRALTYFTRWFGPMPHAKAVIAIVDRKNGTGYSRPGYLVVADVGALPRDNVWGRVGYVAHELSHNWWSNADFTGEDYWLVESTAEYVSLRFLETQVGAAEMRRLAAGKLERARRSGPILGRGRPSDAAVYARAPLLLIDLERSIGRPRLDRLLGEMARRRRLTTADFLARLSQLAGPGVAHRFAANLRAEAFTSPASAP